MKTNNILLISGDAVLDLLIELLKNDEYVIEAVTSSREALDVIKNKNIDLVICDYQLESDNGLNLLEKIVKEQPRALTILMTGHENFKMAVEASNSSVVHRFIIKPWNNEELKSTVSKLLKKDLTQTLNDIKAEQIMSNFVITIDENESMVRAAHLMMRFKISGLPVLSQEGNLAGIITATDLLNIMGSNVLSDNPSFEKKFIKEYMTKEVYTIKRDTSFYEIIKITITKNVHTFPVVENGEIVGVIGRRDILYSYYKLFDR